MGMSKWSNQITLEPTRVGAFSSAIADHVPCPWWLSLDVRRSGDNDERHYEVDYERADHPWR